jgi:NADH-quinone oxidoreductase subunit L
LATIAAFLTAFYMFRLYYMTFTGKLRAENHHTRDHVHESPPVMTVPLMILASLAAVGGFLGLPAFVGSHVMADFLAPVFSAPVVPAAGHAAAEGGHHPDVLMELALMAVSVGVALLGIFTARYFYHVRPEAAAEWAKKEGAIHTVYVTLQNKYYIDEIYDTLITLPAVAVSKTALYGFFDVRVVDGLANGLASAAMGLGGIIRTTQTGRLRDYATVMASGCLILVWLWLRYL